MCTIDSLDQHGTLVQLNSDLARAFTVPAYTHRRAVVPPGKRLLLGQVLFSPRRVGRYEGTLFLRNNLTGLESVRLAGRGAYASLEVRGDRDIIMTESP